MNTNSTALQSAPLHRRILRRVVLPVFVVFASFSIAATGSEAEKRQVGGSDTKVVSARMLPLLTKEGRTQPLAIVCEHHGDPSTVSAYLDDVKLGESKVANGRSTLRFEIPTVDKETQSTVRLATTDGKAIGTATIVRRAVRELTIYIVPHSHVDIGYTELQPKIEAKQVNNLLTALDLIEKSQANPPGSRYSWTVEAAWTIDNLLRDHPEKVTALKQALKAKQVELDAAFANLLTGLSRPEELLRAYAWGARYGQQFGNSVKAAMISDVPGYTWGTVTALAAANVKYFSIGPNYLDRIGTTLQAWEDRPFYWLSPDGQHKVLCWTSYKGYAWSHIIRTINEEPVSTYLDRLEEVKYPYDLTMIRWSGHGDNAVPDPGLIDSVRAWNERYEWPRLKISTVSEPFEQLEKQYADKIPVVRGDWTPYWEDGAASSALETAMNRATAERLVAAETRWAVLRPASDFPAEQFRRAWRGAMLYSEHTWGAHCSITEPECELTKGQWSIKQGYALEADAVSRKLLADADAGSKPVPNAIDVLNSNSWPRSEVLTISAALSAAGDCVRDETGKTVPSQRLASGELAFVANAIPAMSIRRFAISGDEPLRAGDAVATSDALGNAQLHVVIDPSTGNIRELRRPDIAGSEANFVDSKSAGLNEYLYVEGNHFGQPGRSTAAKITVLDAGPIVAAVRVESDAPGCKALTREVRIMAGSDFVECINIVDKAQAIIKPASAGGNSQDPANGKEAVHFAFPFEVAGGKVRMDIPWAVVEPERDQMPGACKNWFTVSRWVDVSNDERGITWAPIDAPLVEVGGITATLIGSQTNPDVWQKQVEPSQTLLSWAMNNYWHTNYCAYQIGPTTFRYALRPHGDYSAASAQRFGIERTQPLVVTAAHERAPQQMPRLQIDSQNVIVTALKPADDGLGYIIRLFAAAGKDEDFHLAWNGRKPTALYCSDTLESKGKKLDDSVHLPAWGVLTIRAE